MKGLLDYLQLLLGEIGRKDIGLLYKGAIRAFFSRGGEVIRGFEEKDLAVSKDEIGIHFWTVAVRLHQSILAVEFHDIRYRTVQVFEILHEKHAFGQESCDWLQDERETSLSPLNERLCILQSGHAMGRMAIQ